MKAITSSGLLLALILAGGCQERTLNPSPVEASHATTLAGALLDDQYKGLKLGSAAPAFRYKTLDGKTVSLKDYAGKTLLVDVFSVT